MKYAMGIMLSLTGTTLLAMQKEQVRSNTSSPARLPALAMRSEIPAEQKQQMQSNMPSPAKGPALHSQRAQAEQREQVRANAASSAKTPADAAQPEIEATKSVSSGASPDDVQSAPTSGRGSKDRRPRAISELDKINLAGILKAERPEAPTVLTNVLYTRAIFN